jgi:hypothetical protein
MGVTLERSYQAAKLISWQVLDHTDQHTLRSRHATQLIDQEKNGRGSHHTLSLTISAAWHKKLCSKVPSASHRSRAQRGHRLTRRLLCGQSLLL